MNAITPIILGRLKLDPEQRTLSGPRGRLQLTPQHFVLFERLMRQPGIIVSHSDLISLAYPDADREPDNANVRIRQIIGRLRVIVSALGCRVTLIQTEYSVGYRMSEEGR